MKKGWKILLICCGICAGIGVVLSVTGTALGGIRDLQEQGRDGLLSLEKITNRSQMRSGVEDLREIRELDVDLSHVGNLQNRPSDTECGMGTVDILFEKKKENKNMEPKRLYRSRDNRVFVECVGVLQIFQCGSGFDPSGNGFVCLCQYWNRTSGIFYRSSDHAGSEIGE